MKKFLALALILTLALSISVFAADRVVGGTDGVHLFPADASSSPTNISITAVAGDVDSRYAIDIQFDGIQIEVSSADLYWDVNELEYKQVNPAAAPAMADQTATVTVINRSDSSIWFSFDVADQVADDGVTFNRDVAHAGDADTRFEVEKAKAKTGTTDGETTDEPFTITIHSEDWKAVANYYAGYFSNGGTTPCTIAIISVKFFPSAS